MKFEDKTLEKIKILALVVIALSTSILALRIDDVIDILIVIANKP